MKQKKIILFRADGGASLGLGHVMRCRSLALELQRLGWFPIFFGNIDIENTHFFQTNFSSINLESSSDLVKTSTSKFHKIKEPEHKNWYQNIKLPLIRPNTENHTTDLGNGEQTAAIALKCKAQVVVVDSYKFNHHDFAALKSANLKVVALDDIANRQIAADLVINPNPLITPSLYKGITPAKILTGERFTLIRPEVLQINKSRSNKKVQENEKENQHKIENETQLKNGHILISIGGGNTVQLLMKILKALPPDLNRQVVVSVMRSCPAHDLENWKNSDSKNRAINYDTNLLPELMSKAALAITAAGTTLWEVYYIGLPSIAIVWVDNQAQAITVVQQMQTSILIDARSGMNEQVLREAIIRLLNDESLAKAMIARQKLLIDGKGAQRIARYIDANYGSI